MKLQLDDVNLAEVGLVQLRVTVKSGVPGDIKVTACASHWSLSKGAAGFIRNLGEMRKNYRGRSTQFDSF